MGEKWGEIEMKATTIMGIIDKHFKEYWFSQLIEQRLCRIIDSITRTRTPYSDQCFRALEEEIKIAYYRGYLDSSSMKLKNNEKV